MPPLLVTLVMMNCVRLASLGCLPGTEGPIAYLFYSLIWYMCGQVVSLILLLTELGDFKPSHVVVSFMIFTYIYLYICKEALTPFPCKVRKEKKEKTPLNIFPSHFTIWSRVCCPCVLYHPSPNVLFWHYTPLTTQILENPGSNNEEGHGCWVFFVKCSASDFFLRRFHFPLFSLIQFSLNSHGQFQPLVISCSTTSK